MTYLKKIKMQPFLYSYHRLKNKNSRDLLTKMDSGSQPGMTAIKHKKTKQADKNLMYGFD